MPNINYNMDETLVNITRPAVMDITESLRQSTGFDKNVKIIFPGDLGTTRQNAELNDNLVGNDKIIIEYQDESMPEYITSTAVGYIEHPVIFSDRRIGFHIKPIYVKTKLTINYKLVSSSRNTIHRWVERMRVILTMNQEVNLHRITYHYTIPENVLKFIRLIHSYTEGFEPYNRAFFSYLTECSPGRLTSVSDSSGLKQIPAIKETQTRIVGKYEFSLLPDKPEKDNETGQWSVNFTYTVFYEKPIALNIDYPIMVHNQLLPKIFTHVPQPPAVAYTSLSTYALEQFLVDEHFYQYVDKNGTLRLPVGDYFEPSAKRKDFTPVFYILTTLEEDKKTLLSLTDLDEFVLDQDVLDFLKTEQPFMFREYNSIFQIFIYRNDNQIPVSKTEITPDLTVKSKVPLSYRDIHRVELSLVNDLHLLTKDALYRLKNNIGIFLKLLITLNDIQSTGNQVRFNYSYQYLLELFALRTSTDITRAIKDFITIPLNGYSDTTSNVVSVTNSGITTVTNIKNIKVEDRIPELFFNNQKSVNNSFRTSSATQVSVNHITTEHIVNTHITTTIISSSIKAAITNKVNNFYMDVAEQYDDYNPPKQLNIFGKEFKPVDTNAGKLTLHQHWLNRYGNPINPNTAVDRYGYYYDRFGVKRHFLGEITNVYLDALRYLHTSEKTVMVTTVVAIKRET